MTQQTPEEKLKQGLADTSEAKVSEVTIGVEHIDRGSAVVPEYFYRHIKYYHVTELELKAISLANWVSTGAFSLGSALIVFVIDILKDLILASDISAETQRFLWYFLPVAIAISASLLVGGYATRCWHRNFIEEIKEQSRNVN